MREMRRKKQPSSYRQNISTKLFHSSSSYIQGFFLLSTTQAQMEKFK